MVLFSGGGSGAGNVTTADVARVRAAVRAAGGTFVARPADAAQQHMSDPNQRVRYQTFPASSGIHNPTTSIWGNYRLPVDPRQAVHNLEHGGVVIWYGPDISAADRGALDAFYDEDENGLIITPIPDPYPGVTYPKHDQLGSKIALTVWTAPDLDRGRDGLHRDPSDVRPEGVRGVQGRVPRQGPGTGAREPASARRQLARMGGSAARHSENASPPGNRESERSCRGRESNPHAP